jgi:hypothetical protein
MPAAGAGTETVIDPVRSVHVAGLVATAVGAAGAVGAGLIVTWTAAEIQVPLL